MTSSIFSQKRTRSQLTLPDELMHQLGSGSPLKHARAAFINSFAPEPAQDDADDELLLSPRKAPPTESNPAKRSASPMPAHEASSSPGSSSSERGSKRLKRDVDHTTIAAKSAHARSMSQPEIANDIRSSYAAQPVENARAQSVPVFPSSSSSTMPRIDFRNPPLSPRRARLRSPSKEPEIRLLSGPSVPRLDTIPDETNETNSIRAVDTANDDSCLQSHPLPTFSNSEDDHANKESAATVEQPPIPFIFEPPSTPATQQPKSLFSMSPLTPIPETPFPPMGMAARKDRYIDPGWGTRFEEEPPQVRSSSLIPPLPELFCVADAHDKTRPPEPSTSAVTKIPRPSSSMGPPSEIPMEQMASSCPKPVPVTKDAFAIMMNQARQDRDSAKGKVRAKTTSSASSSLATSKAKGKINVKGKAKAQEAPQPAKASLKAKMKPKTTPKAKPVPAANLRDARIPSTQQPTLIICTAQSHPISPGPLDVSMHPPLFTGHEISPPAKIFAEIQDLEISEPLVPNDLSEDRVPVRGVSPIPASNAESVPYEDINVRPEDSVAPPRLPSPPANNRAEAIYSGANIPLVGFDVAPSHPPKPAPKGRTGNKRLPSAMPVRITRSVSSQRNADIRDLGSTPISSIKPTLVREKLLSGMTPVSSSTLVTTAKPRPSAAPVATPLGGSEMSTSNLPELPTDSVPDPSRLPPASPMKVDPSGSLMVRKKSDSSFARPTLSTAAKTAPAKPLEFKKPGTPSPSKLLRSASMHSSRPSVSRTSQTSYVGTIVPPSSLSTLSSALEKLRMPPPRRPNTSMGFNRDLGSDDSSTGEAPKMKPQDNLATEETKSGSSPSMAASSVTSGIQLGKQPLNGVTSAAAPASSSSSAGRQPMFNKGAIMRGPGAFKIPGTTRIGGVQSKIFGSGAFAGAVRTRVVQKASRKTSLPSVMASPVKGAAVGDGDMGMDMDGMKDSQEISLQATGDVSKESGVSGARSSAKGKEKEKREEWRANASRRVSLASQALSQSLSALPLANGREASTLGGMGLPTTPVKDGRRDARSASSTYPISAAEGGAVCHREGPEKSPRTRTVTRSLRRAEKVQEMHGDAGATVGKKAGPSAGHTSLKILDGCVIFVDVRNDDGDEVGSLFVEMLEGVGARILTRVGQTCTHIVFKNGLMSTLTRYRLLRDPKPLVVGIAWVVECVEKMTHIDESKFLVDLDGVNVSGTNKRRRSMLPKLISGSFEEGNSSAVDRDIGDADVSMDGSTSSMILEDDLTPLEKARRRRGKT